VVVDRVSENAAYRVRRSARARNARITISEAGEVVVVLPRRAPARDASTLVERHDAWIRRHLARIAERRTALALRPALASGRTLVVGGQVETVRAGTGPERATLERRLRRLARSVIEARVATRSADMGIAHARVTIRDQRTRWGSASRSGTLSFSWRLILCPPDVLDYVVVHELAHLRHAGHGERFWALVEAHGVDASAARRWLRDNRDAVRHALD
jgi:predicted metal-dependent hydrolase